MNNNYDSVGASNNGASTNSQTKRDTSYTGLKRNWLSFVTVFVALFSFVLAQGQSSANYTFTSGTSTLNSMTGSTAIPLTAFPADDLGSIVYPIGFNFIYMGSYYSHFSVNSNGQMRLHTNAAAAALGGSNVSAYALSTVTIAPMGGDNETGNGMSYLVSGSAPNRKLIIEWNNFYANWTDPQTSGNMQLVLYEGTGVFDFLYGNILNSSTSSVTKSIFHSSSNTANSSSYVTVGATPTQNTAATAPVTNTFAATVSIANLANKFFTFTPPVPASGPTALTITGATASTMTLNWTAAATTTGLVRYVVLNSTDGGTTYNFVSNVAIGTNTYAATALVPGTTYNWKVISITEGAESTPALASQATSAAATYYWVGTTGGNLGLAANWNTAADNTGSTRATAATTDILIVDGDGTTAGGATTINVDLASFTIGQFKVISNTNVTLQSSITTTRTITISGSPGDDFVVENGSALNLNNINSAVAFAFSGTGNTGLFAGTINFAGSTANTITTSGGTGTLVTVPSTGVVNLGAAGNSLVGTVASLIFANGSNCNSFGATTGAPPVPLATWGASSNLTITGITSSTTGPTNNNQSFGNIVYNCPSSIGTMSVFTTVTTAVVQGNLTINATNRGRFRATTTGTLTINGNLIINGGTFEVASTSGTVKVLGNVIQNGGRLDITTGTSTASLLVAGQFNQVAGDLIVSGTSSTNKIEFNGTSAQNVTLNGTTTTGPVVYRVNNAAGINLTGTMNINGRGGVIISNGTISGSGSVVYAASHSYTSAAGANNAYVSAAGASNTYVSAAGATSNSTSITVASTAGLLVGMTVTVSAGVGVFAASTTVTAINSPTNFTVSTAPTTALSGGATVISVTGGTIINVQSTDGLNTGMTVTVTSGTGAFAAATTVSAINSPTSFTVSAAPTTPLSGGATVVTATGGTSINVQSTVGLQAGMIVTVSAGAGVFAANTTVASITNATTFVASAAPTTALTGGASVVSGTFAAANTLTYNGTVAQTASVKEFPSTNGPGSLTINNTTTAPNNVVTVPFNRTLAGTLGTLTLTAGILDNSTYILSVPNTAVAAVSAGSVTSYVKGALARNLQASQLTGSTFSFPVGKAAFNPFALVNPTTNAGGTVTVQAEVFDAATGGTAGNLLGSLSSNRYWAASITSGSANFTNTLIRLTDAPNGADAIGGSATLTGAYGLVGGLNPTATTTNLTSTTPEATSILGFYVMGVRATPTISNLAITPTGNRCPNVTRTVSVTVTPGAGAVTGAVINYSINGTAQTAVAMTNTSGNDWSGTIPTVTPANAAVTWSVTATDVNLLTKSQTGTGYTDGGLNNEVITITPSVPNFCGTGGDVTLVASSSITGVTYTWTALTSSAVLPVSSGASVTATISQTSDFKVTGTPNDGGCPSEKFVSVGVYPLPTAIVTTSANGVCPGTSATINSGLSAGNFTATCITPQATISTPPANAVTLVSNNALTTPLPSGVTINSTTNLDDNYWGNIPVGFTFNYFGSNVTNVFIGTNGTINLGTTGSTTYSFPGGFPNTANPASTIAVCARDLRWDSNVLGTIKYWTEGIAPNRKFIVQYYKGQPYSFATGSNTAEAVFYETIGTVDIRVFEATNGTGTTAGNSTSKYVGLQDATKTVGATAPNCTTNAASYWNGQLAEITSPLAWRFAPPANYTTTWTATDANGTTTIATGTNIFSQSVAPAITTTYSISYTNQTTGCTNALGSAQVLMSILGNVAPVGVNTIASATTICLGNSVNLSIDYTGSPDGLTFQWQSSIDNGASWQDVSTATTTSLTVTPTIATQYRCKIVSCNGTPGYSSVANITFANGITSTTPASRCGVGTASLQATGNSGTTIKWYTAATGGTSVGTGSPFVTPQLSASTIYYASAELINTNTSFVGAASDLAINLSSLGSYGMYIASNNSTTINSVGIYPSTSGTLNVTLKDNLGVTIITQAFTIDALEISTTVLKTLNLNGFIVPAGSVGWTLNYDLAINRGGGSYVYPSTTNGFSITGNTVDGDNITAGSRYYFYNWNVTTNAVCASPRVAVPVTFTAAPTFTLSSNAATICSGVPTSSVTVTSATSDFNSYVWSPSTGVIGNETTGWTFNPLTSTTYTLAVNQTSGSLCSNSASFAVTANALPTLVISAPAAVCSPSTIDLTASAVTTGSSTGLTYTYFSDPSATIAVSNPSAITTSGTYYIKGTNANGCSSIASVVVTINPLPTVVTVNPAAVCSPTTVNLTASAVTTGSDSGLTLTYFTDIAATTVLSSANAVASSGTYYIKGTNTNGCSYVASVAVTINPLPTVTTVAPATVCFPSTVNLTASSITTGSDSGLTYTYFTDAAATISYATPSAAVAGTYFIKGTNANGCSSIASVVVSVNQPAAPTGNTTASFCGSANMTNLSATGSGIKWYDAATAGNQIPVLSVIGLTNTTTYFASQTLSGCESVDRLAIAVTINTIPSAPNASAQSFCNSGTVAELAPSGTGLNWYDVATNGTALVSSTVLATGTYFVSQTNATCEGPRTSVAITVNTTGLPTSPAQTFCGTATVSDLVATGSAIKWYAAASGGSALASTATLSTNNYYASQTLNGCEGSRIQVPVTVNTTAAPTATAQSFCGSATIADLVATGTGLQWYAASSGGTTLVSTTALSTGNYYVSQTINSCEGSRTSVSVTVNVTAAPAATAQTFCGATTVANLVATGTAIKWYAAATGGSALASTTALSTTDYFASQTLNGCEGPRVQVAVTVNTTPAPTATAQTFCGATTLANLVATGTGLQWYTASSGGTALVSSTALSTGSYYVSQTLNGCESSRLSVGVTVTSVSTPTGTSPQAIFGGVAADATIEDIFVNGTNVVWYPTLVDALAGTNAILSGTQITNGSTYYAVSVVGSCRSAALAVTVTVTLDKNTFDVANFNYYPNPTSDILNISYSEEITQVRVFNMLGQEVIIRKVNATSTQVDLSSFASGTYFVEVTSDQVSKTIKVVKK